jgi:hypothetical protein
LEKRLGNQKLERPRRMLEDEIKIDLRSRLVVRLETDGSG